MRPTSLPERARARLPALLALGALVVLTAGFMGCEDRRDRTISRGAFIETMVDLRSAAARTPLEGVTEEEAQAIVDRHGVTEEDLRHFVEVHGRDVPMMTEIWNEVERRVRAEADELDAGEDDGSPAQLLPAPGV